MLSSFLAVLLVVVLVAVVLSVVLRLVRRSWPFPPLAPFGPAPARLAGASSSPLLTGPGARLLRATRASSEASSAAGETPSPLSVARPDGLPAAAPRSGRAAAWGARLNRWAQAHLNLAALRRAWTNTLRRPGEDIPDVGARVSLRSAVLELSLITLVILSYSSGFLQRGSGLTLTGNEAAVFQLNSWVLVNSVQQGSFPLWNPYLRAGVPYAGDPMLHIYNPLTSLPVLLLGVVDGYRVALFLSFLAAGWGMWYLGKVLGLAWPARFWLALMFAMAGQPVAKFVQGHYLFVFGFAWIPWAFAGLLAVLQSRRRRHAALAIGALGLLFFSGNMYYAFYMLVLLMLLAPALVLVHRGVAFRLDWARVRVLALVGVAAFGLVALQFLPLAEFWPRLSKATNPRLTDSHTLQQTVLDLTSTELVRADAAATLTPEEYYAYSGWWPFIALALLPLAAWKRERWTLGVFALLLLVVFLWIDLRDMPWRDLYLNVPLLVRFRYPTRLLIYAAFALIVLAGLGLDAAWRMVWPAARPVWQRLLGRAAAPVRSARRLARGAAPLAALAAALLLGFIGWAALDVYRVNQPLAHLTETMPQPARTAAWLRQHDPSIYYVGDYINWHEAWVSNQMRYLPAWLYYEDIRRLDGMENVRPVEARPAYWVLNGGQAPDPGLGPDPRLVRSMDGFDVYELPHSLPFAFVVGRAALAEAGGELRRGDVAPLTPFVPHPNRIELIAESGPGEIVVALTTHYPGWRVTVDGRAARLANVGGYLAAEALPGTHQYVFEYRPAPFYLGLVLSLLSLAFAGFLLVTDWPFRLAGARAALRDAVRLPAWPGPLAQPSPAPRALAVEAWGWRLQLSRVDAQPVERLAILGGVLFVLSLAVYAFTRLYALDRFPIYFFADETVNVLYAEQLLKNGFRDGLGRLFPLYWEADGLRWTPLLSVYVHALTAGLFGKSLYVTRATSAVVSLMGTAAVGLILKSVFKLRFWWVGVLLLALTPAWFLHSRTAFETVMMSSFYACFLLFYLLYRTRSPRYLYPALVFGALAFYTYSNGQSLVAVTAFLLLLSDLRYHWQQRATVGRALLLAALLAVPLALFLASRTNAFSDHLRRVDSFLYRDVPAAHKAWQIVQAYLYALSPQYLFFPNTTDLGRHLLPGYGHMRYQVLPLVLAGLVLCLVNWRSSPHRAVLISVLAAPVGAALVGVGITRVLSLSISAALLGGLGLDWLLTWLVGLFSRRPGAARAATGAAALAAFVLLAGASLLMLRDALVNGPLWNRDYGLYGMQYGAQQLFGDAIPARLAADPRVQIMVSSAWANGTDRFAQFFLTPEQQARVTFRSIDYYLFEQRALDDVLLVMTPGEYAAAQESGKFKALAVDQILPYPDGSPGFYFIRPAYVDNVAEIFAAEIAARRQPVQDTFALDGQTLAVIHSRLDAGSLPDLFDGDTFTLVRGLEANPFLIELHFPAPRLIGSLALDLGAMQSFSVTVTATSPGGVPQVVGDVYNGLPADPHVELSLPAPGPVSVLRVEIKNLLSGEFAQVHVRELTLRDE